MNAELDHLVVVARTLEEGMRWCEATLGVVPAAGGKHPLMGTHNRVLAVGGAGFERAYLEVIAVDPGAPPPGRARWFGMDDEAPSPPRLSHFVVRTTNLDMLRWGLTAAGFDPGETLAAERGTLAGLLRWRITVPADGRPPADGALPTLIEWAGLHPADALPDSGVALETFTVRGLPAQAANVLRLRGVAVADDAPGPRLQARLRTPRGLVTLASSS